MYNYRTLPTLFADFSTCIGKTCFLTLLVNSSVVFINCAGNSPALYIL